MGFIAENQSLRRSVLGSGLAVLVGLLLWGTPLGARWENASYDLLFFFGSRPAEASIVQVLMDEDSYQQLKQSREALWDRNLHAQLLDKLTGDGATLVVFDLLFKRTNNPATDARLANAMLRNGRVVFIADMTDGTNPELDSVSVKPPPELFLNAAAGCGVGRINTVTGGVARRHWPFLAPGEGSLHSVGWTAAQFFGAHWDLSARRQWLRYYGQSGPGQRLPYYRALMEPAGFFCGKIVFIGSWPEKPDDTGFNEANNDKFCTPYTRWNGQAVGGVSIHATTFLNLVKGDWLRRLPDGVEAGLVLVAGILVGGGLCRLKPLTSLLAATGVGLGVMLACVIWSYYGNDWFPWLVIAGGQVPCALAWAWVSRTRSVKFFHERFPGYTPVGQPFGRGAYGKVWLVRNATGQWQALKEIERSKFERDSPYEREFQGIKSYKPISNQHPGLLHIDHVNINETEGYFYYVMELGDALTLDWERLGETYQPRDLVAVCRQMPSRQLPVRDCLSLGASLLEGVDFLHGQGLVHRDIKPANIVFVNGRPKLADVGLIRDVSPDGAAVGTPGYMPPAPEPNGTRAADLYAMGKLLYVISTGYSVKDFPALPEALVESPDFMRLNEIICQACRPAGEDRYASAAEMLLALRAAQIPK